MRAMLISTGLFDWFWHLRTHRFKAPHKFFFSFLGWTNNVPLRLRESTRSMCGPSTLRTAQRCNHHSRRFCIFFFPFAAHLWKFDFFFGSIFEYIFMNRPVSVGLCKIYDIVNKKEGKISIKIKHHFLLVSSRYISFRVPPLLFRPLLLSIFK